MLGRYAPHLHKARATNDHPEYTLSCLALAVGGEVTDGHAVAPLVPMLLHHEPVPRPSRAVDSTPAADTFVDRLDKLAVGSMVMLSPMGAGAESRPCALTRMNRYGMGAKYGFPKLQVTGTDIFRPTTKPIENILRLEANVSCPVVKHVPYTLLDVTSDGYLSLLDDADDVREDLPLPPDPAVCAALRADFKAGKAITVTVVSAVGEEAALSYTVGAST